MDARQKNRIERALVAELDRLKDMYNTGHNLGIHYLPAADRRNKRGNRLLGEVQGSTILLYEEDEQKALRTLMHEFVEYMIKQSAAGYLLVINKQKEIIERLLYERDEELVERIARAMPAVRH